MPARINIPIGTRFGKLVVKEWSKEDRKWRCLCDCGNTTLAISSNLRSGATRSCGCARYRTHGLSYSAEYAIWANMKNRCLNPQAAGYENYGGRGITVCERWLDSFEAFYQDMGARPSPQHSVDRIDNNKGYSPDNCRWATQTEQRRNVRNNHLLTYQGETRCTSEWAELRGLSIHTLRTRLERGWSVERALAMPMRHFKA